MRVKFTSSQRLHPNDFYNENNVNHTDLCVIN
jgi:hypothetical protein